MSTPTALVLGASGALGSRLVERLAAAGTDVIGTASSAASLDRVPVSAAHRIVVDLRTADSCAALVTQVAEIAPALNGVVVASGVVGFATIESTPPDLAASMMAINHLGPAAIVAGLLPQLQATEPGSAFVLGISGVVVEQTFAGMSAYTASKTAHSSFLQTLSREWRRHKIAAIDVRLGHTETGLATRPLFGTAPQMPSGHDPDKAVAVIMAAIAERAAVVPATAFS